MSDPAHEPGPRDESDPLAAVAAARRAAADRLVTPWWYHPILGGLTVVMMMTVALGEDLTMLVGPAVFFVGIALLVLAYRRQTGVWVGGLDSPAAAPLAAVVGVVVGAGLVVSISMGVLGVPAGFIWALAAAVFVTIVVLGRRYDEVLRADLRGER